MVVPDEADQHEQVGRVHVHDGITVFFRGVEPVRLGQESRKQRRRDKTRRPPGRSSRRCGRCHKRRAATRRCAASGTEIYLLTCMTSEASATPENSATVLKRSIEQSGDHHKERGAEAEFLANQVGKALAGDHAHARAHFLADVEGDRHGNQRPEKRVAELRAGRGSRC